MAKPKIEQFQHSGIVLDYPAEEVPVDSWTSGANVEFLMESTRRCGGYARFAGTPSGSGPLFAMAVVYGAVAYWIYCTSTQVFVTDGVTHWDITPAAGLNTTLAGEWNGCILNGVPVLNNSHNDPFYWNLNTAAPCVPLPGWPSGARCKVIRAFKYHLFALNVSQGTAYPSTLWWSCAAEPGAVPITWTPLATNDAGDMTLGDTPGGIVNALQLRDMLIVYKEASTYAVSYVAGQYVYTQRKLFLTTGVQSAECVSEINGEHWVFTGTDVIRHDGQNYVSVVQDKVRRTLVDSVDPQNYKMSCVAARNRKNQVWVCIPTQGQTALNRAYVINALTGDVGERELPLVDFVAKGIVTAGIATVSWDSDAEAWDADITTWDQQTYSPTDDSLLMCDQGDNALWGVDTSDLNDGVPVSAFVERQAIPIGNKVLRGLVTRVIPRLEGGAGDVIKIRVGGQAYFGQPVAWSEPMDFVIGTTVGVACQVEGRMMAIRFESDTQRAWTLHSYKLNTVDLGLY